MKNRDNVCTIMLFVLVCFVPSPAARALLPWPSPDGAYPNLNTAEGQNALFNLTTGAWNTALGAYSLFSDTIGGGNIAVGLNALHNNVNGYFNAAVGVQALSANVNGNQNCAFGDYALFADTASFNSAFGWAALALNTTGTSNTAIGYQALLNNSGASDNTAVGDSALYGNTAGFQNTAVGENALLGDVDGDGNTAVGCEALLRSSGVHNTAVGSFALRNNNVNENTATGYAALDNDNPNNNTIGPDNTAIGVEAIGGYGEIGSYNTGVGAGALRGLTIGDDNTAVGFSALETGEPNSTNRVDTAIGFGAGSSQNGNRSFSVYIGQGTAGVDGETGHTYIRNINFTGVSGGEADTVTVDLTTGLVGHLTSSRRYKEDISPMGNVSEALYRLSPVSYHYKKEIDPTHARAFGLVAEKVAEVNPDLVAYNPQGQPESVHYEMVNAMLLNEFLKEQKRVEAQKAKIAKLKSTVAEQQMELKTMVAELREQGAQIQEIRLQVQIPNPQHGRSLIIDNVRERQ